MRRAHLFAFLFAASTLCAQQALVLPPVTLPAAPERAESFHFVSDSPIGPGWSRPDEIARAYFSGSLPTFFRRTIVLDNPVPQHGKLSWVFTGPRAGFTVELAPGHIRLYQRAYDSSALYTAGSYPEKITRDDDMPYIGTARTITVVLDAHLSIQVYLNDTLVLRQSCAIDVTRTQAIFTAPRTGHLTLNGYLAPPTIAASTIAADSTHPHQTMLGFGGSPSIPAYAALSPEGKRQYWELLKRYNLLLDREYPMGSQLKQDLSNLENLADATPHYYGDNFPNGEVSSFDYSRHALDLGGEVIYEMWALPPWATQPYTNTGKPILDAWNKPVRTAARPEEYARIVVEFCRQAKQHTGHAPSIVGIQNEVEQPPEVFTAMATTLRRELDKAGFQSTKIHLADASFLWMGIDRARLLSQDKAGWKAIDYTAAHEYDFQEFFANPDLYDARLLAMHTASRDKPFLATEICLNDPHLQEPSYRIAFQVAQLYQKNLTELDAEALMYCWLLLDVEQPSFGASRSLLVPDRTHNQIPVASSFQLRVLGAFSRQVFKGMHRVESTTQNPDLLTAAFEGNNKAALIVLNRGTEPQHLDLHWPSHTFTHVERTSFYQENEPATTPADLIIQPGEILTLTP